MLSATAMHITVSAELEGDEDSQQGEMALGPSVSVAWAVSIRDVRYFLVRP